MTPTARAELRRYCADAARARAGREPWTFSDRTDAVVAVLCVLGFTAFGGWEARRIYEANKRAEPKVRLVQEIAPRPPLIDCTQQGREEYARTCLARKRSSLTGIRQQ